MPVDLNRVRRIADGEPIAARPATAVVTEGGPQLINAFRKANLDPQDQCGRRSIAIEDVMGVVTCHDDRVWVEIKAGPITSLGVG